MVFGDTCEWDETIGKSAPYFFVKYTTMTISKFASIAILCFSALAFVSCGDDDDDKENGTGNNVNNGKHEYVDLGLPSGTLWATCNIGANKPEEVGDYFAWGETKPKTGYNSDWSDYKWCNGSWDKLTKYCTWDKYGIVDNKMELEPEDDAATANWGSDWCMPTMEQIEELCNQEYTTDEVTTLNGVKGKMITSKTNGNTIFLPVTTGIVDGELFDFGPDYIIGHFWSRSLNKRFEESKAYQLVFNEKKNLNCTGQYRRIGQTIRPVRAKK